MFVEDLEVYNPQEVKINNAREQSLYLLTNKETAFSGFLKLKDVVQCPFAKAAVIVDHMEWDQTINFSENLKVLANSLDIFINRCEDYRLDAFLVTAPSSYSLSPAMLGEFLRRILFHLSENDPSGLSALKEDLSDPAWRYRYSCMKFFISTFSPCYGPDSSRSTHGIDQTIIIFQPKSSFERTLSTRKTTKRTQHQYIRDKFCMAGIPYNLRDLEWQRFVFPYNYQDKAIEWWKPDYSFNFENKPVIRPRACVVM